MIDEDGAIWQLIASFYLFKVNNVLIVNEGNSNVTYSTIGFREKNTIIKKTCQLPVGLTILKVSHKKAKEK